MKVLLITRSDEEGLSIYRSLQRQDVQVVWYAGVFHDLWRHLGQGVVYMYRVIPEQLGDWGTPEKVELKDYSMAFVEESLHDSSEGVLGHTLQGGHKGFDLTTALTAQGVVCIGFSAREDCLTELAASGAVATMAKAKMTKSLRHVIAEGKRLFDENSPHGEGMKALTLREPWAWATMVAGKDMENRVWPAKVRGTIAIHASGDALPAVYTAASAFIAGAVRKQGTRLFQMPPLDKLPRNAIVGVVDIVDVVTSSDSPWFEGPFAFVLATPRPLPEPIPCDGKRRFFTLPKSVERKVRHLLSIE